jgi:hypothetical protein
MGRDAALAKRARRFWGRKMRATTPKGRSPTFQSAPDGRKSL